MNAAAPIDLIDDDYLDDDAIVAVITTCEILRMRVARLAENCEDGKHEECLTCAARPACLSIRE